jgi:hypothetical protein
MLRPFLCRAARALLHERPGPSEPELPVVRCAVSVARTATIAAALDKTELQARFDPGDNSRAVR